MDKRVTSVAEFVQELTTERLITWGPHAFLPRPRGFRAL